MRPTTMDEREAKDDETLLLEYARTGDEDALTRLVARHWPHAFRVALRLLGDPGTAEDAAQEAFVKLAQHAGRFAAGRPFLPWLRTLVLNASRNHARSQRRRTKHEERGAKERVVTVPSEGERRIAEIELAEHVGRLPLELRFPVVLHFYEGCSYEEVAATLGCPKPTVQSRIRSGLERLRGTLAASSPALTLPELESSFASARAAHGSTPAPTPPSAALLRVAAHKAARFALTVKAVALCAALALPVGLAAIFSHDSSARATAESGAGAGDGDRDKARPSGGGETSLADADQGPPSEGSGTGAADPSEGRRSTESGPRAARASSPLAVTVRDNRGAPVPNADVIVEADDAIEPDPDSDDPPSHHHRPDLARLSHALTDSAGVARFASLGLELGRRVHAFARRGADEGASASFAIGSARANVAVRPFVVVEPGKCAVVGRLAGGDTLIFDKEDAWTADPTAPQESRKSGGSDGEGRYALANVPPGAYRFLFSGGRFAGAHFEVTLEPGQVLVRDVALTKGCTLTGTLAGAPAGSFEGTRLGLGTTLFPNWHSSMDGSVSPLGTFSFAAVAPGSYELTALVPGFRRASASLEIADVATATAPTLVVGDGPLRGRGRVVSPKGLPFASAIVCFDDVGEAHTGADGTFVFHGLRPGPCTATVRVAQGHDHVPTESAFERKVVLDTQDFDLGDVVLVFEPALARLKGRVVGPDGQPVTAATLLIDTPRNRARFEEARPDGTFDIGDLEPVRTRIDVRGVGSLTIARSIYVDLASDQTATLEIALVEGGKVRGKVAAPQERLAPASDRERLRVTVTPVEIENVASLNLQEAVADDGSYEIPCVPPGRYEAFIYGATGRVPLEVRGGGTTVVDFSIADATASVNFDVAGLGPHQMIWLEATWTRPGCPPGSAINSSESATGTLRYLPPGPVHMKLCFSEGLKGEWITEKDVMVASAGTRVSFAIPGESECGSIRGRVAPSATRRWALAVGDGGSLDRVLAADGSFELRRCLPGKYRVLVTDDRVDRPGEGVVVEVSAGVATSVEGVPVFEEKKPGR